MKIVVREFDPANLMISEEVKEGEINDIVDEVGACLWDLVRGHRLEIEMLEE